MATKVIEQYKRRKHKVNTIIKNHNHDFRLVVNKSNKFTYGQIVDKAGNIVASARDKTMKRDNKIHGAQLVGESLATQIKEKKLEGIAFDRNGYRYHGRIKAMADAIRAAGIQL